MRVRLTNMSGGPVPVSSSQDGGWCDMLIPGEPFDVDRDEVSELLVGDHPRAGALGLKSQALWSLLVEWIAFWRKHAPLEDDQLLVRVHVMNESANPVYVVLGRPPGATGLVRSLVLSGKAATVCEGSGWVELRQLPAHTV